MKMSARGLEGGLPLDVISGRLACIVTRMMRSSGWPA